MEKDDYQDQCRERAAQSRAEDVRDLYKCEQADLTDRERSVVELRFSLNNHKSRGMTLKQIGQELSLSKERIRQIESRALGKLREVVRGQGVAS